MPLTPKKTRAALALAVDALHPQGHAGLGPTLRAHAAAAVQSTAVVTAIRPLAALPARLVGDALDRAAKLAPDAIGLGDPGDREQAAALADALAEHAARAPLVCAPGAVDRRGEPRFDPAALAVLAERLWRHADAVIVDGAEAALVTGRPAPDLPRMRDAAKRLFDRGPTWVVITGGRAEGHAVDLAYDGRDFTELGADRIALDRPTGAGATFAGLVVAGRARGRALLDALAAAKQGVGHALAHAVPVGPSDRADPLGPAFAALGLDPRPIEVPSAEGD
ncbi:MAG: PfkB family carbohydrate kinase [bacterium]